MSYLNFWKSLTINWWRKSPSQAPNALCHHPLNSSKFLKPSLFNSRSGCRTKLGVIIHINVPISRSPIKKRLNIVLLTGVACRACFRVYSGDILLNGSRAQYLGGNRNFFSRNCLLIGFRLVAVRYTSIFSGGEADYSWEFFFRVFSVVFFGPFKSKSEFLFTLFSPSSLFPAAERPPLYFFHAKWVLHLCITPCYSRL